MDYVEDVEKYVPGGYHPVDIGDEIIGTGDQPYEVMHKLCYGGFSTVWLVRSSGDMPSYFALKILCANTPDVDELNILQHLQRSAGTHPNVMTSYDSFNVSGANGEHQCLVFPVLGPSLHNPRVADALPAPVRHQVCCQLASAIAFLHATGSVMAISRHLTWYSNFQTFNPCHRPCYISCWALSRPRTSKLPTGSFSPHPQKQVIQAPAFPGLDYSSLSVVWIVDFRQAFFADRPPRSLGVPIDFFPPELCFSYSPSTESDVWQLACAIYMVHAEVPMFLTFFRIFGILVGTVVGYLGPLPREWKGRFMFEEYGYREPGREPDKTEPAWWFEDKQSEKSVGSRLSQEARHLSVHQREEYVRLLLDMVAYEPEKRLTVADVIQRLKSAAFLGE